MGIRERRVPGPPFRFSAESNGWGPRNPRREQAGGVRPPAGPSPRARTHRRTIRAKPGTPRPVLCPQGGANDRNRPLPRTGGGAGCKAAASRAHARRRKARAHNAREGHAPPATGRPGPQTGPPNCHPGSCPDLFRVSGVRHRRCGRRGRRRPGRGNPRALDMSPESQPPAEGPAAGLHEENMTPHDIP